MLIPVMSLLHIAFFSCTQFSTSSLITLFVKLIVISHLHCISNASICLQSTFHKAILWPYVFWKLFLISTSIRLIRVAFSWLCSPAAHIVLSYWPYTRTILSYCPCSRNSPFLHLISCNLIFILLLLLVFTSYFSFLLISYKHFL